MAEHRWRLGFRVRLLSSSKGCDRTTKCVPREGTRLVAGAHGRSRWKNAEGAIGVRDDAVVIGALLDPNRRYAELPSESLRFVHRETL
jgi:hypothetical protein